MKSWQLQEAKNRFSEVVRRARTEGPQIITVRGTDAAVVISLAEFRRAQARRGTLTEFLQTSPLRFIDLDLERPPDAAPDLEW